MTNREWVQPGAKVAIYQNGYRGSVLGYDEIDRVLKRDIVLKSGRRFYFRTNYQSEPQERGRTGSYYTTILLPPNHIRVRNAETGQRESKARVAVELAFRQWNTQTPTVRTANALLNAVEAWKALQPQDAAS